MVARKIHSYRAGAYQTRRGAGMLLLLLLLLLLFGGSGSLGIRSFGKNFLIFPGPCRLFSDPSGGFFQEVSGCPTTLDGPSEYQGWIFVTFVRCETC